MNIKEKDPMCCCSAEVGTKIFAYVNLVLVCTSTLIFSIALLFYIVMVVLDYFNYSSGLYTCVLLFITVFLLWIAVVFSVFLLAGVLKKKPAYIQAYLIYGVIVAVLSSFSIFYIICKIDIVLIVAGFLISMYCLILAMIGRTYRKYQTQHIQLNHEPLSEKAQII